MSQTVAGTLVDVLEKIGVRQIFGLIGDSLNPLADAVRHSNIEWVGVRHEEGAALAAAGQAKLTGRLAVCCGTTGPGAPISSPVSMKQTATTRRFLRSPGQCRASWRASSISRRQIATSCSVTPRFIPRPFLRLHKRRRHPPGHCRCLCRAAASPI